MSNTPEFDARYASLMQTKAICIASRFPGLDINLNETGSYDITHSIDDSFNLKNIPLESLLVSTKSILMELRSRYGENGELLDKVPLAFAVHALPAL